jgi:hypothetical protein
MKRLRLLVCSVVIVMAAGSVLPGCRNAFQGESCFDWPTDAACPAADIAVLYMGDSLQGCDSELVSVDSDGEHVDETCCYQTTISNGDGCGELL